MAAMVRSRTAKPPPDKMDVISAEAQTGLWGIVDSPKSRDGDGAVSQRFRDGEEKGPMKVRKRKRKKKTVRFTARCSVLLVLSPLGRAAPLPVSFDNETDMHLSCLCTPGCESLQQWLPFCAKVYS